MPLSRSCGSMWCKRVSRWRHPTSVQNISLMIPSSRRPRHSGMPSRRSVTRWKAEAIQASTRVPPWGIPLGLGTLHVLDQVDIEGRHWTDDDFKTEHFQAHLSWMICLALFGFFYQRLSCLSLPLFCHGPLIRSSFQFDFPSLSLAGLIPDDSRVSRKSGRNSSTFLV